MTSPSPRFSPDLVKEVCAARKWTIRNGEWVEVSRQIARNSRGQIIEIPEGISITEPK